MSKQLLLFFALVCAMLVATASSVMAQDLRPEDTFFLKPRIGISNYLGDNEKSPFNFNGDAYEAGFPYSVALELGYQFSVPFSVSLAYQLGNYTVITQFPPPPERTIDDIKGDPTTRSSIQLFGRYTFAKARTKTALFVDFGLAYSFGDVLQNTPPNFATEESGSAFGPLLGIGLDIVMNDKTSFFIEMVSGIHLSDTELDANDTNGFGSTDILTGIGFGLKFNFKGPFTPVEVFSVTCPGTLTVGEGGTFTATANGDVASQPVDYHWDFGDGSTATGQNASHSYAQAGTYTITFTATNSGSTDSGTCTVRVIAPSEIVTITANKTTVSICDPDPSVSFSGNVRGDAPLSYNWDFGDGTTSTQANPSHTYQDTGTYTVTLTLTNSAGSDTRTMSITINDEGCFDCNITEMNSVFFDRNSSVLTPEAREALMENVEIFRNCPNINARLEGYASRDERNTQKLSEDRARAVEQFYIDNGVAASRLQAVGMGATGQTTKKGGASQFRRVDTLPTTDPIPVPDPDPDPIPVPDPDPDPVPNMPDARQVVISGNVVGANRVWTITVDGQPHSGTTVNVNAGDTVEWRVATGFHGVTFQNFSNAQAFLSFDSSVGQPIKAQPQFGANAQGTDGQSSGLLARATVQNQTTLSSLDFICTVHGPSMNGQLTK